MALQAEHKKTLSKPTRPPSGRGVGHPLESAECPRFGKGFENCALRQPSAAAASSIPEGRLGECAGLVYVLDNM
jgi:hypothetical protein